MSRDDDTIYPTREKAIEATLESLEDGEVMVVHEEHCTWLRDEVCTCNPVIHQPKGRA